ncbi:MAG: replication initiator protein [Wigfec virus K19_83]|nr:MAG: replication initiator protein [Wigfec virus K19_83]
MNKKNGGNVPVCNDERQKWVWIPCGQCYICKKKKAREWRMRIAEDIKENKNGKILLLTFNTESLKKLAKELKGITGYELDNQICKLAIKRWRERWRKKYGRSPRHWFITELGHGKTEHVHMHGIIWPDERYKLEDEILNEVEKTWGYGFVGRGKLDYNTGKYINYVNEKTASYFTKYVNKIDEVHKEYKQIILTSPGIGKNFLESDKVKDNKYRGENTNQMYNMTNGGVLPMPEYFRRKLYTDEEREKLTSNMLDKKIIYIAGKEFRADIGDDKINLMYKILQDKNARMGYGDGTKNYERKTIENARRREIHKKRLNK